MRIAIDYLVGSFVGIGSQNQNILTRFISYVTDFITNLPIAGGLSLLFGIIGVLAATPILGKFYLYYFFEPGISLRLPLPAEWSEENQRYEIDYEYLRGPGPEQRAFPYNILYNGEKNSTLKIFIYSDIRLNTKDLFSDEIIDTGTEDQKYYYELESKSFPLPTPFSDESEPIDDSSGEEESDDRGSKRPISRSITIPARDLGDFGETNTVYFPLNPEPPTNPPPSEYQVKFSLIPVFEMSEFRVPLLNKPIPSFYGEVELQPISESMTVVVE